MSSVMGRGVQIVEVLDDHTYELDMPGLEGLLKRPDVRNLPVAVVSVAGAYRGGKSFLHNFFLRYLTATDEAREDGSWLSAGGSVLKGFSWRGGSERNTTGIVMWSEPLIVSLPDGKKMCVVLVDTQGTFDSSSTVRDNSTIFALSTLISSVQVYNLSHNIKEDDLQHLQLFTEYGRLLKDDDETSFEKERPFQTLTFLIRDWLNAYEHPYGYSGGAVLLQKRLEIRREQPRELRELREHLHSCFDHINCFLMPHPGFAIANQHFNGNVEDLTKDFCEQLTELVKSILDPTKLQAKIINGEHVKAEDLFTYIKSYMTIFNSDQLPTPVTIMKATAQASLQAAVEEGLSQYCVATSSVRDAMRPAMTSPALCALHQAATNTARKAFTAKKKMGSSADLEKFLADLEQRCETERAQLEALNVEKVRSADAAARGSYDRCIKEAVGERQLCLHSLDLDALQAKAVSAALSEYDTRRQRADQDDERDKFIKSFEKDLSNLRASNEQNNKSLVSKLQLQYLTEMQHAATSQPPLAAPAFQQQHDQAQNRQLISFNSARLVQGNHPEDEYKTQLLQNITSKFTALSAQNNERVEEERRRVDELARLEREKEEQAAREAEERRAKESAQQALAIEAEKRGQAEAATATAKAEADRARADAEKTRNKRRFNISFGPLSLSF